MMLRLKELFGFMRARKAAWLIPALVMMTALGCRQAPTEPVNPLIGELPLTELYADHPEAVVHSGTPSEIKTAAKRFAYAAKIQPEVARLAQAPRFVFDLEVKQGAVQVGLLSKDGGRFLKTDVVQAGAGHQTLSLALDPQDRQDFGLIVFANGLDRDEASEAVIYSIKVDDAK